MTTDLPGKLLVLLAILTALGVVIGYCVALIRVKHSARKAIELAHLELAQERSAIESDFQAQINGARQLSDSGAFDETTELGDIYDDTIPMATDEEQTAHVLSLEAQVAALEDKHIQLQRDFASYKSTKTRQLELARGASSVLNDTQDLPTLSRRVESEKGISPNRRSDLGYALSSDLEIPTLAESELPDSLDEMEFDIADSEFVEAKPGG